LPVGYHRDPEGFAAGVTQTVDELARWFDKLDPSDVARARIRSFLTTRSSLVTGTLEGLLDLDAITDETRVRRRRLSVCELQPDGDRLAVLLGDRELRMPAHLEPAMRDLAAREQFRPS